MSWPRICFGGAWQSRVAAPTAALLLAVIESNSCWPPTAIRQLTRRRLEFEKNLAVEKRDFGAIEYMLRKGQRQLEIYADPGIRDVHR